MPLNTEDLEFIFYKHIILGIKVKVESIKRYANTTVAYGIYKDTENKFIRIRLFDGDLEFLT